MQQEILATVKPSAPRRWTGVGMLSIVGALVLYVALTTPPEPAWLVFLLAVGAGAFWLAYRMWQATSDWIELTESELRTGAGQLIAKVEDIETVERGVFAFKPSNGFLVRTRTKAPNTWAPGLWWRVGHRIGVGGMTSAAETKFMSEMLFALAPHSADKTRPTQPKRPCR
ncbi:hypothetical protein [Ruegeria sp. Ofav3-42]|uniref:hypothetical protein n=1 Tax=Ruegeria sp. Ofav3-42 TaxID=2917759 RepID=UPI001EF57FDC|nr:hypothetical protein [Ruegeria sp. Ofav3-42]MCG7519762.1 hypothetical protein [Ruegeria sp. Ofav3-42]